MVQRFRRYWTDTIGHTHGTTDGQSDSSITPPPLRAQAENMPRCAIGYLGQIVICTSSPAKRHLRNSIFMNFIQNQGDILNKIFQLFLFFFLFCLFLFCLFSLFSLFSFLYLLPAEENIFSKRLVPLIMIHLSLLWAYMLDTSKNRYEVLQVSVLTRFCISHACFCFY